MEVAKGEDEWDKILFAQGIRESGDEVGEASQRQKRKKWTTEIYGALGYTYQAIVKEGQKNKEMAEKMVGIIDREKELAEVERKERRKVKNEERRKTKAERDGVDKTSKEVTEKSKDQ